MIAQFRPSFTNMKQMMTDDNKKNNVLKLFLLTEFVPFNFKT